MTDTPMKSITRARPSRYADVTTPITAADAHAEPPGERVMREPSVITLTTAFEYRGYHLTVIAQGMTLDTFYDMLNTDYLFTISAGVAHGERFTVIERTNTSVNGFCDMLDKKFGVPS